MEIEFKFGQVPHATLIGWGKHTSHKLSNADIIARHGLDSTPEIIKKLTGIEERGIEDRREIATSDLGSWAARQALHKAGLSPNEVDRILFATTTGDYNIGGTGDNAQHKIGARNAAATDLNAACAGFIFALEPAFALVRAGMARNVLVIAADKLSAAVDWTDRKSCVLFGDAGSAVVVAPAVWTPRRLPFPVFDLHSDASQQKILYTKTGGSRHPTTKEALEKHEDKLFMDGHEVFKFATRVLPKSINDVLKKADIPKEEIDIMIPGQANLRIIEKVAKDTHFPMDKVFVNITTEGNTSAPSIGIAITDAVEQGRLNRGMLVLLTSIGSGFNWGSVILEWTGEISHQQPLTEKIADTWETVKRRFFFWRPSTSLVLAEVSTTLVEQNPLVTH